MEQIARKRLFSALIIPMLLIPMASLAYAHFTDSVVKKYKMYIEFPLVEMGSYKVTSKWDDCLIKKSLQDNTLTIQTQIFPGWFAWIGLVLHNSGDRLCQVCGPSFNIYDPNHVWPYFKHTEYLYGPYDKGGFATANPKVWDSLKWWELPPKASPTTPPIALEPNDKMVLWIKLEFKPPSAHSCNKFKIRISVYVPCDPDLIEDRCWTWPLP